MLIGAGAAPRPQSETRGQPWSGRTGGCVVTGMRKRPTGRVHGTRARGGRSNQRACLALRPLAPPLSDHEGTRRARRDILAVTPPFSAVQVARQAPELLTS